MSEEIKNESSNTCIKLGLSEEMHESSNTCIKLNLSEENFCHETTTTTKLALRCNSSLLVPSVAELHRLLSVKFAESIGNTELFIERKSVIEIGKLLKMYHQKCETVQLS